MKTKQLAEMIKHLRKQKLDEQMRDPPPAHKRLTPDQHQGAITGGIRRKHRNLAGTAVQSKYVFKEEEEIKDKKLKTKNTINTTPEQDSAMIGTQ